MSAMGVRSTRDIRSMIEKLHDTKQKEQLRIMFQNFLDATGG